MFKLIFTAGCKIATLLQECICLTEFAQDTAPDHLKCFSAVTFYEAARPAITSVHTL